MDVLQSFYSNFIPFFGTNLLTPCPVPVAVFCLFFTSKEINIKWSPNTTKLFVDFYGPKDIQWAKAAPGVPPTRARLGPQARPGGLCPPCWPPTPPHARLGGLCPPRWPPAPPLCTINSQIFRNPSRLTKIKSSTLAGLRSHCKPI